MASVVARCVLLVEGESDAAAVRTTARALGRDLAAAGVDVVAMGGATNIRRHLNAARAAGLRAGGLCDADEERSFRRALGPDSDLAAAGFFVCHADLEDEFVRALGAERVLAVLDANGEGARFAAFSRQPAQRDRPVEARLRRFLGTQSGRKIRYGGLLAEAAAPDRVPEPLRDLLAWCAS